MVFLALVTYALTIAGEPKPNQPPSPSLKVAIFLPHDLFRDEEFDAVMRILERAEITTVVVSSDTTAARGIDGLTVKPQQLLNKINPADFSALVLIDGSGITTYWNDTVLGRCCREFLEAGRFVVGIELAPIVLARARLLKERYATVYPDFYCINLLKEYGARHRFNDIVIDKNILTVSKAEHTGKAMRLLVKILKAK